MTNSTTRYYAAKLGRKGGKAGTGKAKKRTPEHYALMVKKRNAQRKREANK
jgi:hypothetical protein